MRDDTPHPLTDFTWRGQVINGGPIVEYSGRSFSHIKRQVAMDVPGFTWNSTWESQNHATNGSHTEMILGMVSLQLRAISRDTIY